MYNRFILIWLFSILFCISLIVIIGGITRLTESGLSITDWKPILGVIPPVSSEAWKNEFKKYQKTPEYQSENTKIVLSDFKKIYFWEYIHRLLARVIGFIFFFPFVIFCFKRFFSVGEAFKMFSLFFLGGLQGLFGWYMVQSGLIYNVDVSHYRLAIHLLLAFLIASLTLLFILEKIKLPSVSNEYKKMSSSYILFAIIFFLQILYGAFSAGLKSGKIFNTWPLMAGEWFPTFILKDIVFTPKTLFENIAVVQFIHRMLGIILLFIACIFLVKNIFFSSFWTSFERRITFIFVVLVGLQFILGVSTLLFAVPIWLGIIHQFFAFILVLWVTFCLKYISKNSESL